jgi:hypothetical protein
MVNLVQAATSRRRPWWGTNGSGPAATRSEKKKKSRGKVLDDFFHDCILQMKSWLRFSTAVARDEPEYAAARPL